METTSKQETVKALAAFNEYCLLGSSRSLAKLAEMWGKSEAYVGQLERWSSAYNWVARAREYDASLADRMHKEYAERREQDFTLIRDMLLKHITAEVEVTASSQIQAARALLEYYVITDELNRLRAQLNEIVEALRELGACI